jgi:pyruvate dehydrogenase E2 component (dihydrolipoamide acetyltransferase)
MRLRRSSTFLSLRSWVLGRIAARPAVVDDQIVPRKLMALSLTFDHRVADGAAAAGFLRTVREFIELPALWMLE